ncbi:DUF6875 domain-containing protein [Nocardia sp. NPDC057227]|uniref:DUF6875 domain-containing protein n=1 Tax=Nocardia sp. NPDC057227 TaxID=3346056 RepID=UPI003625FB28
MTYLLSDPDSVVADTVSHWLVDYVGRPHPLLGRDGPVCPFVIPALKAGSLSVRQHRWRGQPDISRMAGLIDAILDHFHASVPDARPGDLHTLVVPVIGLPGSAWWLIDDGHRRAKTRVAARGYMLGQFHPACTEPAVHNALFPVNRAPYPLFAVRPMALHDLLFLHEDPIWFEQYRQRFGHRYHGGGRVSPQLRGLYSAASRQYGCRQPAEFSAATEGRS